LERRAADPMGFAGMATPGQILPLTTQIVLKLSADQKTAVAALQEEVDGKVEALLDDDQEEQMKQMRARMARGGPPGSRPRGPADGTLWRLRQFGLPGLPLREGLPRPGRQGPDAGQDRRGTRTQGTGEGSEARCAVRPRPRAGIVKICQRARDPRCALARGV